MILAEDTELGRLVAVKLLRQSLPDLESRRRFEREARLTADLRHPGVIEVYDFGASDDGDAYILYAYLEGRSLADWLEDRGPAEDLRVRRWGGAVAEALAAVHARGVLHRDVKPANILLRGDDQPVLCDFGIARSMQRTTAITQEGLVLGTPSYMAPEVLFGEEPGAAADQFALGVTLHLLRTGHGVYPGESVEAILDAARGHHPLLRAGPGDALGDALARAVARRPEDRFPDLGAFAAALRAEGATARLDARASTGPPSQAATRLARAATPARVRPPGATTPARRARLALLGGASVGVVALALLARSPAPPGPPVATEPVPGEQPPGPPSAPSLTDLLADIGLSRDVHPWLQIEPLLEDPEAPMADEIPDLLRRARPDPLVEALILRQLEAQGTWSPEVASRIVAALDAPRVATWHEGLRTLMAVSAGLALGAESPEVQARVSRTRLLALRGAIEHGDELWRAGLATLFWDLLARRIAARPSLHLRALEETRRAFEGVQDRIHELPPGLRTLVAVAITRAARHLDGIERCALLSAHHQPLVDGELAAAPEARDYWFRKLFEEEAKAREFFAIDLANLVYAVDPARLPLRPDEPGSGVPGAPVPDPAASPAPPTRLEWRPGEDPRQAFREAYPAARRRAVGLELPPGWADAMVASGDLAGLVEDLASLPEVAAAVAAAARRSGATPLEAAVVHEAVRRGRLGGRVPVFPRSWWTGPRARTRLRQIELLHAQGGDGVARAASLAEAWVAEWRGLPPPVSRGELAALEELRARARSAGWGRVAEEPGGPR